MRYEHEKTRRHAENTIAEANRHLDSGRIKDPRHHQMLTAMIKDATATLDNLDRMDDARPYSDTNIGYNADVRRHSRMDVIDNAMDAISRILPHIADDYDVDMRRGVPGTGPYANPRLRRRGGRHGIGRRRYEMDDDRTYDDFDDDRYDDDVDDDVEARRGRRRRRNRYGRFMDARDEGYADDEMRRTMDDARRTVDDARRTADDARRTAEAAADTARRTIYPGTPVMPRTDDRARYDDADHTRNDDTAVDRIHRPGPR